MWPQCFEYRFLSLRLPSFFDCYGYILKTSVKAIVLEESMHVATDFMLSNDDLAGEKLFVVTLT
jgi:hypothetical protein